MSVQAALSSSKKVPLKCHMSQESCPGLLCFAVPVRTQRVGKGYAKLYEPGPDGTRRLREAACWTYLRRDFHDFWTSTKSEIAREAFDRIGKFYDIERGINGRPAEARRAARQMLGRPRLSAMV